MSKQLATVLIAAYSAGSFADCLNIADDRQRLACYDKAAQGRLSDSLEVTTVKPSGDFDVDEMAFPEIYSYFDSRPLFQLTPHEPNYMLPVSYNSRPNKAVWQQLKPDAEINDIEVKFQLSGKMKVWDSLYNSDWDLWLGYTQTAWWQLYNGDESAPFRDTNYRPEISASRYTPVDILGFTLMQTTIGLLHESNGRSELVSRSWNRLYAEVELAKGNYLLSIRPWYRLPEDKVDDDNPDIHNFMGYGDYRLSYKNGGHLYSVLLRNNLRGDDNRGGVELSWAFPLNDAVKAYFQYYNGYGESLIDYNYSVNRLSVGILIYDWL